jgi:purine/pyrimidine-nucleoside phosphorylase
MTKHNTYFDGNVQSLGFERNGRRATVGVVQPGEFHFDTGGAERMIIVSGELLARLPGGAWKHYPVGTAFEIPAKTGFDIQASGPAAYVCEFI